MHSSRKAIGAGCIILLSEVLIVNRLGPSRNGALLSNPIQLSLGILVVMVTLQTARRSGKLGRYFWHLTALAYSIGALAQALSTYSQSFYPGFAKGFADIRFAFWFVPMGMALFLKQDSGYTAFDWLANIDLTQAVLGLCLRLFCPNALGITSVDHRAPTAFWIRPGIRSCALE